MQGPDGNAATDNGDDTVDHQLSLFFGNADGHAGLLCLPVPRNRVDVTAVAVARWNETCEVPLVWAGRTCSTIEDWTWHSNNC